MEDMCPFKPIHSVEWLENYFTENCFKKPYDRFMWWRSYVTKKKPLFAHAHLKDKVMNGDYDLPHYGYEAELVEHKLRHAYLTRSDITGFNEAQGLNMSRRKRLLEDQIKEDTKRLEGLYKDCKKNYGLTKEQVQDEIMDLDGDSVKDLYLVLEKKYGVKNVAVPKFK